jgi:alanine-glyoxylate transaminase / serine-glyoxylate transaminase / serine-pyruvate transaminase
MSSSPAPRARLANGRPYLAIPGPSSMPDRVLAAMHKPAPNIYDGDLHAMVAGLFPDLKTVAQTTAGHVAIYIANGHGTWEAANANLFSRGDRVLVLATGRFGVGWAESVRHMGVEVEMLDFGNAATIDPQRLGDALRADRGHAYKAVLMTHVDTATSVRNDVAAVRAVMDAAGHPALLAVDAIASLGCDPILMDAWGIDVLVSACQKGLMTPPGLGFIWVSDKAIERCRTSDLRSPYWDWTPRIFGTEFWQKFCGTAPTHHLFGLREALTMILHEEGLTAVWARHDVLARAVAAAVEAWGQGHPRIGLNIADPALRANAVTAVRFGAPDGTRLRDWTEREAGVTLGIGLGMAAPSDPAFHGFLRVAHMGHVNAHMTLGVLSVMEAGLCDLDIPHGDGAMDAAIRVVAQG